MPIRDDDVVDGWCVYCAKTVSHLDVGCPCDMAVAARACPHGEPLHFDKDGCPECSCPETTWG